MYCVHYIVFELLSSIVQKNLTMVLEVVYSTAKKKVAQSMSKQIWDILYKDIIALKVMQLKGDEEESMHNKEDSDDDDMESEGTNLEDLPLGYHRWMSTYCLVAITIRS